MSGVITPQDITTLGTYEAPSANTNIRIKKLDDAVMPGWYEVHLHNDWVNASGNCRTLGIHLSAAGMAPLPIEIALTLLNPETVMRGTDSAALASVNTEARLAELDAANLPTDIAAIPTTAMRGTDSAALAAVCTEARLAQLAEAALPAKIDSLITSVSAFANRKTSIYTG
jgi:hypothetical protein